MWTLTRELAKQDQLELHCYVKSSESSGASGPWPMEVNDVRLHVRVDRFWNIRHHVGQCLDLRRFRVKRFSPSLIWELPWLLLTRPFRERDPAPCCPDPALADEEIDVWITFGVNEASSRVIATAVETKCPSFLFVQSNSGVDERLSTSEEFTNECGESSATRRYALQNADRIVCQSEWQLKKLHDVFGWEGVLARNPIDRRHWLRRDQSSRGDYLLWIGRYDNFHKRPLMMLDVAAKLPDVPIRMVVNSLDAEIERQVRQQCPDNVTLIDQVPFASMPDLFSSARVFVSTGNPEVEGFPNVLLQAAASHTPIVSLFDYDGFLRHSGAGTSSEGSVTELAEQVRHCWDRPETNERMPDIGTWQKVDAYLDQHHEVTRIAAELAELIRERCQSFGDLDVPATT